jgi:hypothetical protein
MNKNEETNTAAAGHTPGPWKVSTIDDTIFDPILLVVAGDYGSDMDWRVSVVADVRTGWNGHEANARLIAAAPDMLAALKEVAEWAGKETAQLDHMADAMVALLLAREAIAKAEGAPA